MSIFKSSLFGYNKKQVEDFLKKHSQNDKNAMEKQKQRIVLLREENTHLTLKLNGYKHREKAILAAMVDSRNHAENIINQSRKKAILELQSLKTDIDYIKSMDSLTPNELTLALDRTCRIISEQIEEIAKGE